MSYVEHRTHDGGLLALGQRLHALDVKRVRVGYIKGRSSPQTEEDGLTCAQVAAWNTYGTQTPDNTEHIPARPFMQEGLLRGRFGMARLNRINLVLVLKGKLSVFQALDKLGALATGWVKRAIAESKTWAKPNAPRTIRQKTINGKVGDQPLKDSGSMQQAATWSVD